MIIACGNDDGTAGAGAAAGAAPPAQADSALGEVAQYALMKNSIGWLTDSNLVSLATLVNQSAISLSRIEAQLWSNERIRSFALEILRDHAALQQSIDSLASRRRIPPQRPAVADLIAAPYDSIVASLAGLPLQQMEPGFIDAMTALHGRTAKDFAALAGNATDPDLRALLANRALLLEQVHVSRAKVVAAAVAKADSAKKGGRETRQP